MPDFDYLSFRLSESFFDGYRLRTPKWGFNAGAGNTLGEYAWLTKYSRQKTDGTRERFWEGLRRVIEGMYSIQKDYALSQSSLGMMSKPHVPLRKRMSGLSQVSGVRRVVVCG